MKIALISFSIILVITLATVWSTRSHITRYFIGTSFEWRQEITLHVKTPDGPRSASSVQQMKVKYFPDGMFAAGTERVYELQGEAVVLELGQGRVLFALIGSDEMAERTYWDLWDRDYRGKMLQIVTRQIGKPARVIPRKYYPRLVTFSDLNDPTSVSLVEPDDLAASFGEGYAFEKITIAVTHEQETEGFVKEVLGEDFFRRWVGTYRAALERGVRDPFFDTLAGQLNRSHFSKR